MGTATLRSVKISERTYQSLKEVLADQQSETTSTDVSLIVEAAVAKLLFERTVAGMHEATKGVPESEIAQIIKEAVDWARKTRF